MSTKVSIESQVAQAAVLNREIKERAAQLEVLKVAIREYATKANLKRPATEQDEKIEIESPEGVATVSFPRDAVLLVAGANPRALKETLSATTWDHLFEERVALKPEFEEAFRLLSKEDRFHVRTVVDWKPRDPAVILPK